MLLFWRTEALLFLSAAAARLLFRFLTGFTADDAFITYRYAENILHGHGLVYNIGERVLGTSTPLFTLLLATVGIFPGTVPSWSLFLSLIASGLTAVILYRFARSLRFASFAILPSLLYICWPRSLPADTSGMETAFFTLLITAAFYAQHKKQVHWGIGLATLATLCRPEGVLLLLLLIVMNGYARPRKLFSYCLSPLLLILPWALFAFYYFGSPVPNSIVAKLALYSQFGSEPILDKLMLLLWLNNPLGWVTLIGVAVGTVWLHRKQNAGRIELLWIVLMILFFTLSNTHLFFWYVAPIYPTVLLIASAGVVSLSDRLFQSRPGQDRCAVWCSVAAVCALFAVDIIPVRQCRDNAELLENQHAAIGYYLLAHAKESDIVAAEDIGYIGYVSRLRIIDRDGLVSPEVVPYNRIGDYGGVIGAFRPEWVVAAEASPISGFMGEESFSQSYELLRRFGETDAQGYLLFHRR